MAKTNASSNAVTGEKMAPPSISLLPEKKSPTNGDSSPVRTGRTTPSNAEKKPHMNGHASPSHLTSNNHGGKQSQEGYMKTDDRMRLAKERREERERSLAAREQLIREKERRARLQYERTVEERWRRLEEQRQKEELRRAAVEEKRRQQLEEERERLEALMKRSLERSLQLEQRTKRWGRGYPGAGDCENAPIPFSAAFAFSHGIASPHPAVSGSAPCSPHRSPFCNTLNSAAHSRTGLQGGSQSTPSTPKKERLRRERRTASPGCGSPLRRSESPASVTKRLTSPNASRLSSKMRAQSPGSSPQYHHSPNRHHPNLSDDKKGDDKKPERKGEQPQANPIAKTNADTSNLKQSPHSPFDKNLNRNPPEKNPADRRNQMSPRMDSSERRLQVNGQTGDKESTAVASTGKVGAGTSNAEEATRLLAERRRQARAQKELEEIKEQKEQEERKEEQRKQLAQGEQRQEAKAQQGEVGQNNMTDHHRMKLEEDKRKEEQRQNQIEAEKEKAKVQAEKDAERERQGRELQTQQEEEERQLRKKRIEEIMKRTRKGEADMKMEEQVETKLVSPPGDVITKARVIKHQSKKVEFQVAEQKTEQIQTKESVFLKKETAAAQADSEKGKQVQNNSHLVTQTHGVSEKRPEKKQTSKENGGSQLNREVNTSSFKQQGRETDLNLNKQHKTNVKISTQTYKELTESTGDVKVMERQGRVMNGAVKGEESALTIPKGGTQQSSVSVSAEGKVKKGPDDGGGRPSVTVVPVARLPPPVIKLEPLDVKQAGSGDEVQSMDVSPASKEELISIPEYSPDKDIHQSFMTHNQALKDLMDLTGSVTHAKLPSETTMGDCNKNLIRGVVSPLSDSKLIGVTPPSSNKLNV
ncbi:PREDICTED: MAP7 domain-containing protein 2-like isoform X2 [Cyprinodon variegatus]|uniref:MAP7 domain-containing protein 2-like isoform X2 n=1 Tax=Cyprinodon variegatus TaxID=28743 RepID=UPI0007425301|nr:PREDICTED: MAP7 domain-containing protein 2-like isoform X2 [Cyprinodon variegatus]